MVFVWPKKKMNFLHEGIMSDYYENSPKADI